MIGIQRLHITNNKCAYFIKRPFGNYIFFADELESISDRDIKLIDSQGGISKVFIESIENLNTFHYKLFERYGASAVCDIQKDIINANIKIERLKDHSDPSVKFLYHGEKKLIFFKQKDMNVLIAGKNLFFEEVKNIKFQDKNILNDILQLRQKLKFDIMYFTNYNKDSALNFNIKRNLPLKVITFLKNLIN